MSPSASLPPPLIAICGTTGAGKSDLAVHLAHRLGNGEILNSDTLQVYRGLDIITNKMPLDDRLGVPHHLLDVRSVHESYSVKEFEADALHLIETLRARKLPCVLVGGTHYYLQYLLWGDELSVTDRDTNATVNPVPIPSDLNLSSLSPAQLHALLAQLDPVAARQWHVNDTRRVRRSVERFYQRGCVPLPPPPAPSPNKGDEPLTQLRFPTLVIWVHTDQPVLDQRLDKRVDDMVDKGLFDELWRLRLTLAKVRHQDGGEHQTEDRSRGVEQAIGIKEFDEYCALVESFAREAGVDVAGALDHDARDDESDPDPVVRAIKLAQMESTRTQLDQILALRTTSLDAMKLATRKYARRQISWLRARLSPRIARHPDSAHMLVVDTTHVTSREDFTASVADKVFPIARAFVDAFMFEGGGDDSSAWKVDPVSVHPRAIELLKLADQRARLDEELAGSGMECKACERKFRTRQEWEAHKGSRAHRRVVKQKRKESSKEAAYWERQKCECGESESNGSNEEREGESDRPSKLARRAQDHDSC